MKEGIERSEEAKARVGTRQEMEHSEGRDIKEWIGMTEMGGEGGG